MPEFSDEEIQEAIARIRTTINEHPIVLYMKGSQKAPHCGFSAKVINILDQYDLGPLYAVDILAPENQAVREALKDPSWEQQWATFPQLFVNAELVGGCDIVTELHNSGKLSKVLGKPLAKASARS